MTELRDFLKLMNRFRYLILAGMAVFGLGAVLVPLALPSEYEAVMTLYVRRAAEGSSAAFYTFDGYYSQQAAERYTDTVVGLLESKGLLQDALGAIGLPTDQKTLEKVRQSVEVKKVAPQLVEVKVWRRSGEEAAVIAGSLATKVSERVRNLNESGDKALSLEFLTPKPLVEKNQPELVVNGLVGILAGFLISILGVALRQYLRG